MPFRISIKTFQKAILVCCFFICSASLLKGQVSNVGNNRNGASDVKKIVSDTTGFAEKALDNSVLIHYTDVDDRDHKLDSSIIDLHRSHLLGLWDVDLGNLGSVYQSLKIDLDENIRFRLLPNKFERLSYTLDKERFYNTTKPYSEVYYSSGSKQEQMLELLHTQNIKPNWNFSTKYRKISSLGFYKFQKNNIDNFSFNSDYKSDNQRYALRGSFLYNKIQQDENLGIISESYLKDPQYNNLQAIPVAAPSSATTGSLITNYNRNVHVGLEQTYAFGTYRLSMEKDSAYRKEFVPIIYIGNEIYVQSERYCFEHDRADSVFAFAYFPYFKNYDDSLKISYNNLVLGSNFSVQADIKLSRYNFLLKGGLGVEYQKIGGDLLQEKTANNYFFARLWNPILSDGDWKINTTLKVYTTGLPKGNLLFNSELSKKLGRKNQMVGLRVAQNISKPSYVSNSIQLEGQEYVLNFKSPISTRLSAFYTHSTWGLHAELTSLLFTQLIYWDLSKQSFSQYANPISIQQAEINKLFTWRKWQNENSLLLQLSSSSIPIQIPSFSSRHGIAYTDKIFKDKLSIATGLNMYYNTTYSVDAYQPVFQSFAPQYSTQRAIAPRFSAFFNFKVKTFRAFVSVDQLQHLFISNNINYLGYPSPNTLLRLGFIWAFVN